MAKKKTIAGKSKVKKAKILEPKASSSSLKSKKEAPNKKRAQGKEKTSQLLQRVNATEPSESLPRLVEPEIVGITEAKAEETEKALTVQDPLTTYLNEVRKYPLLTREREEELAKKYFETGDPKAAEILVTSNLRFVVKVAAEYSKFGARMIDLVQEGNVGLLHAVKEFNPYKGVRLITYAVWWIRGYIQEYLLRQYSMVRIGTTQAQRKLFYQLQKEKEALEALGSEPDVALLSSRLGVEESEVREMSQRLRNRDVSLNQPVDDEGNTSLLDFQTDGGESPDDQLGHAEEIKLLMENVEEIRPELSEREIYLLENRLLAENPITLQDVGDKYQVTREAVRQMETRLIEKIRKRLLAKMSRSEIKD